MTVNQCKAQAKRVLTELLSEGCDYSDITVIITQLGQLVDRDILRSYELRRLSRRKVRL